MARVPKNYQGMAAKGVKTDKGFKEIHITKAAKAVSQLLGYEVTTTQVSNHLRKWKARYEKIEKLRMLSGALWDDEQKVILLEEQHYLGHTQVCTCSLLISAIRYC
jgi:methionine salvage enolase-phosphatase E1